MIQYLTFLLVIILVIDRAYRLDYKNLIKLFRFRKRFKDWVWSKVPRSTGEQLHERRQEALRSISVEDLATLSNYVDMSWKNESAWTPEEIEQKRKRDLVWDKVSINEIHMRNLWIKSQNPLIYYLIKLRLI